MEKSYIQPDVGQRSISKLQKPRVQWCAHRKESVHLTGTTGVSGLPGAVSARWEVRTVEAGWWDSDRNMTTLMYLLSSLGAILRTGRLNHFKLNKTKQTPVAFYNK